ERNRESSNVSSWRESTTGTRAGRRARTKSFIHRRRSPTTTSYRKRMGAQRLVLVDALTLSVARRDRNVVAFSLAEFARITLPVEKPRRSPKLDHFCCREMTQSESTS